MADEKDEIHRDLAASVEARRELGPAYEDELVQSFVEKIDATIERRVDERMAQAANRGASHGEDRDEGSGQQFAFALASLGMGIPITAVAAGTGGVAGTVVAWAGIVGVNAAYAWSRRGKGR